MAEEAPKPRQSGAGPQPTRRFVCCSLQEGKIKKVVFWTRKKNKERKKERK